MSRSPARRGSPCVGQMREEILGTTRRHFTEFADVMAEAAKAGTVCVLGGSAAENAATEHGWTKKKVL